MSERIALCPVDMFAEFAIVDVDPDGDYPCIKARCLECKGLWDLSDLKGIDWLPLIRAAF